MKFRKRNPRAFSESKSSAANKAFDALARMLLRRDHSEKEIRTKLGRWYTPEAVDIAVQKAADAGYLKDPQDLRQQLANSLHRKNRGYRKIQFELKKRGLPTNLDFDPEIELAKALRHVDKVHAIGDDLTMPRRMKIQRLLMNRGFSGDTINAVFQQLRNGQNEKR
jgi:regulatory protein